MGSFPFLTPGDLEVARDRWKRQAPGTAAALLRENVELALSDPHFASPLQLGLAGNLFQVQCILFEASLAFACSGQERYLEPVMRCLSEVAEESVRRERLPSELHLAFVLVGLAVAYELCGEAIDRVLLEGTVAKIAGELYEASACKEWGERVLKRNAWNHTAVAFAAIGCGGLLCRELDPRAQRWLADALDRLRLFFADGVTDAGMTREGLSYCGFVFRNAAPLLLAARNAGVWDYRSPQQNPYLERLRRVPRWYAIETLPGGSWLQPINDSSWSPKRAMGGFLPTFGALDPAVSAWVYETLLGSRGDGSHGQHRSMAASSLFESVLWAAAATSAETTELPIELPDVLADPAVGYVAERFRMAPASGFSLNCGEYIGGIHDQSDNGSVTLLAGNVPLLIDSGTANDPVEGSPSSSQGHNIVLIDGRGQLPSGGGWGCTGTIVGMRRGSEAMLISADLAASYTARGYNPVAHAVRHCLFAKHPFTYLLLVDDFSRPDGQEAVFEQLFHTPPVTACELLPGGLCMRVEFEGAARDLELRALDEGARVEQGEQGEAFAQRDRALFDGHPVWRIRREGSHVTMPTLILPFAGEQPPDVMCDFEADRGRVTLCWRVPEGEGTDVLVFDPGTAQAAMFTRNGAEPADIGPLSGPFTTPPARCPTVAL
jgi:hypothetical protein